MKISNISILQNLNKTKQNSNHLGFQKSITYPSAPYNDRFSYQMNDETFKNLDYEERIFYEENLLYNNDFKELAKSKYFEGIDGVKKLINISRSLKVSIDNENDKLYDNLDKYHFVEYGKYAINPYYSVSDYFMRNYANPTLGECLSYLNKSLKLENIPENTKVRIVFNADELNYHKSILKFIDTYPQEVIDKTANLQYKGIYPNNTGKLSYI